MECHYDRWKLNGERLEWLVVVVEVCRRKLISFPSLEAQLEEGEK